MQSLKIASLTTVLFLAPFAPGQGVLIERASVSSLGVEADNACWTNSISADGRLIAFSSWATTLVPGDTNNCQDVFLRDKVTKKTTRLSKGLNGTQANWSSYYLMITPDGRFAAFLSEGSNLVENDTNMATDVFVLDRQSGVTSRVSVSTSGEQGNGSCSGYPSISADGRYVGFYSKASNLVPGDNNGEGDAFIHDRQTGITSVVSISSTGEFGNKWASPPYVSDDGRYAGFCSPSSNLAPGDTNGHYDVFLRDRLLGTTELISASPLGQPANQASWGGEIAHDGSCMIYYSDASNLVSGDTNRASDVFVYDFQTRTTTRVSKSSTGAQGNYGSFGFSLSQDGRFVGFSSYATDLVPGDTNAEEDVFVHDRQTGETKRLSLSNTGEEPNRSCFGTVISGDGRCVAFTSYADNLVPGDRNIREDVYVSESLDLPFILTLNKALVAGDNSVMGTISVDPSHLSGASFTVSDDSALIETPARVTILPDRFSANFRIKASPVSAPVLTHIFASRGSLTKSLPLTLTPLAPTAMAFTPNPVVGGNGVSCRVVLNGVAGPEGLTLTVADNSPYAVAPATVTVVPGATQVIFPITTSPTTTFKYVILTVQSGPNQRTGHFRIDP